MARKLTINDLERIIREEVEAAGKDEVDLGGGTPNDAANKTKEVEACDYADTLEQQVNHMKAYKIKEEKALRIAKAAREKRLALEESIKTKKEALEKKKLVEENKQLKEKLRKATKNK